jgi:hypothetical protein
MKTFLPLAIAIVSISSSASAALVAAWDFQTTTNGGTAVLAAPNTPNVLTANFGSGALYLNGANGSSSWVTTTTPSNTNEVSAFAGTAINADTDIGMATSTAVGALALLGGAGSGSPATYAANGKGIVFALNLEGLQNLTVSLAAQRTSTGFTSQIWETSIDGSSWSSWGSFASGTGVGTITTGFANSGVLSLNGTSALDNAATAYVRVTFFGATGSSGNNRLDNIIFNADVIPTPGALALLGLAGIVMRRRR